MKRETGFNFNRETPMRPLMVEVTHPDRLDAALKKLKRMIKDSRIMVEFQDHLEFVRPSQKRRLKRLRSIARAKHEQRMDD